MPFKYHVTIFTDDVRAEPMMTHWLKIQPCNLLSK